MASLSRQEQNTVAPTVLNVSMSEPRHINSLLESFSHQQKWVYLISSNLTFTGDSKHGIRLNKPAKDQTFSWLKKIIQAGKTCAIFVDDLVLGDLSLSRLKQLCRLHNVSVISLKPSKSNNLIYGPW